MKLVLDVEVGPPGGLDERGMQVLAGWLERDDAIKAVVLKPDGVITTPFAFLAVRSIKVEGA